MPRPPREIVRDKRSLIKSNADENRVTRAAFFQAAPHTLHLDAESGVPQALLEPSVVPRRPDRENPAVSERRASRGEPRVVVEPGVPRRGERGGARYPGRE